MKTRRCVLIRDGKVKNIFHTRACLDIFFREGDLIVEIDVATAMENLERGDD